MNTQALSIEDMATKKVTVRLDERVLAEVRQLVGPRGLSAFVNEAVVEELRMRRRDQFLREAEERAGPIPPEVLARAEKLLAGEVEEW
jgi:Arc/MetJ family transcription regulator